MKRLNRRLAATILGLAVLLGPGCSDDPTKSDPRAPNFALIDVNPNSERHNETVSPRDYVGSISAYYFGAAT